MVDNNDNNINNDPDVNINSWTFIEKYSTQKPFIYYFKDEVSSVQELTEDDLGSTETNSESDGFSIISESEENIQPEENEESVFDNNTDYISDSNDNLPVDTNNSETLKVLSKNFTANNKVILFTIVTSMCFMATYFLWPKNTSEVLIDEVIEHDFSFDDMTFNKALNNIYDKHIWGSYKNTNKTCDFNLDIITNKLNDLNPAFIQTYKDIKTNMPLPVDSLLLSNSFELPKVIENKFDVHPRFKRNVKTKHVSNTKYSNKKEKNLKSKNSYKNGREYHTKIIRMKERYLDKKDKHLTKKEKYLKKLEKIFKKFEAKLRQTYQHMKKYSRKQKSNIPKKSAPKIKENKKKYVKHNITGDWYLKMYSARSDLRYKEKLSDWLFDRSKMRSKLRQKMRIYHAKS